MCDFLLTDAILGEVQQPPYPAGKLILAHGPADTDIQTSPLPFSGLAKLSSKPSTMGTGRPAAQGGRGGVVQAIAAIQEQTVLSWLRAVHAEGSRSPRAPRVIAPDIFSPALL